MTNASYLEINAAQWHRTRLEQLLEHPNAMGCCFWASGDATVCWFAALGRLVSQLSISIYLPPVVSLHPRTFALAFARAGLAGATVQRDAVAGDLFYDERPVTLPRRGPHRHGLLLYATTHTRNATTHASV